LKKSIYLLVSVALKSLNSAKFSKHFTITLIIIIIIIIIVIIINSYEVILNVGLLMAF